ncbi:response regulator [Burkholderia gladioli]|uniref:response regulator n=1 Tax=Burkholderia gladioli TaxID=28095 RepID=UPI0003A205D0|nr:response regulator transcription factor [Burkholderia gladioli]NHH79680.1 Response regulator UvrY [Burkholderia gladioli]
MKKVLLVERHAITRAGIRRILETTQDFLVGCELANGDEMLSEVDGKTFDVAILDFSSLGQRGLALIRQLAVHVPTLRILVISANSDPVQAKSVFSAGAGGFLAKRNSGAEMLQAVRLVLSGRRYLSPDVAEHMVLMIDLPFDAPRHARLSTQETKVLRHLACGEPVAEIARDMGLSNKTISTYKARLFDKLAVRSDAALVRYALAHRLVDPCV